MAKTRNIAKTVDRKINAAGKNMGLNYFERRKVVKGVHAFAYDTGVNVASSLIVSGVEGAAYLAGRAVAATATGIITVAKGTAHAAGNAVSHAKAKVAAKKSANIDNSTAEDFEEVEETVEGETADVSGDSK